MSIATDIIIMGVDAFFPGEKDTVWNMSLDRDTGKAPSPSLFSWELKKNPYSRGSEYPRSPNSDATKRRPVPNGPR